MGKKPSYLALSVRQLVERCTFESCLQGPIKVDSRSATYSIRVQACITCLSVIKQAWDRAVIKRTRHSRHILSVLPPWGWSLLTSPCCRSTRRAPIRGLVVDSNAREDTGCLTVGRTSLRLQEGVADRLLKVRRKRLVGFLFRDVCTKAAAGSSFFCSF